MDAGESILGVAQADQNSFDRGQTQLDAESSKTIHGLQTVIIGIFRYHCWELKNPVKVKILPGFPLKRI